MDSHVVSLIVGIIFGACLVLAGLSNPDRIIGALRLKDSYIIRTVIVFLLVGMLGTWIVEQLGTSEINHKPAAIVTLIIGGLLVGAGLGLTGYSPCTSLAGAATGRIDALTTFIGMFLGAHAFVIIYPLVIKPLEEVYNSGKVTLPEKTGVSSEVWLIPALAIGSIVLFLTRALDGNGSKKSDENGNSKAAINEEIFDLQSPRPIPKEDVFRIKNDFLDASQALRTRKNLLFMIIVLCLLILQVSFWLISTDYISVNNENVNDVPLNITFENIITVLNISNTILIAAAVLYVLTIFFCLSASFGGSFGGLRYISRSFFSALVLLILLLPWQIVFGKVTLGAIFTPSDLAKCGSVDIEQTFNAVIVYLRFVGYWAFVMLLLIRSQVYSHRWSKSVFGRIEEVL